jgi:hypothetical protein
MKRVTLILAVLVLLLARVGQANGGIIAATQAGSNFLDLFSSSAFRPTSVRAPGDVYGIVANPNVADQLFVNTANGVYTFDTGTCAFQKLFGFGGSNILLAEAVNPSPSPPPATPEPSPLTLLGIGAVCSLGYCWRRRR